MGAAGSPAIGEEATDRRSIARLRRIVTALGQRDEPHPADSAWLIGAVARYETARRAGLTLDMDAAMGLGFAGRVGWWSDERRARRDELLRELHRRYFADFSPGRAAAAISALAHELEQIGLDAIRNDERLSLAAEAMLTGQPLPGYRQLKRILD